MQICTDWFPAADAASDLDLIGVIPAAYPKTFVPVKNFTFDVNFFVFAGDKLVYQCIENQVERLKEHFQCRLEIFSARWLCWWN